MDQKTRLRFSEEEAENTIPSEGERPKSGKRFSKERRLSFARATDEATGKAPVRKAPARLRMEEKPKPPSKLTHGSPPLLTDTIRRQSDEEENTGAEAAREGERAIASTTRFAARSARTRKLKARRRLEKTQDSASLHGLSGQQKPSSNPYSRWRQKRAIRKSYYEAVRTGRASASGAASRTFAQRGKEAVRSLAVRKKKSFLLLGCLAAMLAFFLNALSSCSPLVEGVLQSVVIAAYPAEDADILAAERYYCGLEEELKQKIASYQASHPEYDAFQFEVDDIWHDPHALISLVSARINGQWTVEDAYGYLDLLFSKQYALTEEVKSETRYRRETVTHYAKEVNEETGEVRWIPYQAEEEVPYAYKTATVTLDNFNLSHLPFYVLSREGVGRYAMYISVLGMREDLFRGNRYASTLREPGRHDVPEEYFEDETFRRILEEAEKYIGYPYVWGGDSPETSFDCSGFVSYVFANSGVRNVGRLGATSLYARCRKISPEEAQPGDLVFFEGTISGEEGITHVGIYVGDHWMLHCGSPIGYADLCESYWQKHYYGYGRLANE